MNGPKIFALHLPSIFIGMFDSDTTIWDDKCFAIKGDVVQGMVSIINFPDDVFNVITNRVKTLEYMLENLEELHDMPLFPAVLDNEDETEVIYRPTFKSAHGVEPKPTLFLCLHRNMHRPHQYSAHHPGLPPLP
jgi:hypothetical protein